MLFTEVGSLIWCCGLANIMVKFPEIHKPNIIKNMAAKKGRFVTPEEIDEFLDDLASDFEVSDESEDEGKCLMLFIEIFRGYFTFLKDFYEKFFLGKSVFFYLTL